MKTLLEAAQDYFGLDPGDTGYVDAKVALWNAIEAEKDEGEAKAKTKEKWPMLGQYYYRAKDDGAYQPFAMLKHYVTGEVMVGYVSLDNSIMVAVPLEQWNKEWRPDNTEREKECGY